MQDFGVFVVFGKIAIHKYEVRDHKSSTNIVSSCGNSTQYSQYSQYSYSIFDPATRKKAPQLDFFCTFVSGVSRTASPNFPLFFELRRSNSVETPSCDAAEG